MATYPFKKIEKKWQKRWTESRLNTVDLARVERKLYCLVMYIYPSGEKLHIGHWYNYGPTDTWARYQRMLGFDVFEPMGYDAFGLPAENYAISHGVHPAVSTAENINQIRRQLEAIGAMYDWDKEVDTSSPEYYRWTQWLFLQLYHKDLAVRKKAPVNWCPSCKTVLANEQVVEGECERCGEAVIHKDLEQWFFRITEYADRLLEGLDRIEWPEKTKSMQRNWIGRSEGVEIIFRAESGQAIPVFTTRPDTLFGVTYMVLAPEHLLVQELTTKEHQKEVAEYVDLTRRESEIQRTSTEKEKTGIFTGAYAINPINDEKVPIWIADYVLLTYGTGAVMAVPAHDQRDFEFAKKYGLDIRQVIKPEGDTSDEELNEAYIEHGEMINSEKFDGLNSETGKERVADALEQKSMGERRVNYKIRDWLISRQRYWGAPIPMIYCDGCGIVPVPEKDLPVLLPEEVDFSVQGTGQSPLATSPDFVNTTCPKCGQKARREVDTMDTFVCSSWYFLRYLSPRSSEAPFDTKLAKKWLPVDQYVGGAEHAVMHLLYARFVTKVLYDLDLITFDEPFTRLAHQGTITKDGAKMSKSKGNVVSPDRFIDEYGSDTFRVYLMFMGSYQDGGDWSDEGIVGIYRFLNRIWRLLQQCLEEKANGSDPPDQELIRVMNYSIKHVGIDLDRFHFNTAISRIMEFVNALYLYVGEAPPKGRSAAFLDQAMETLVKLIAPVAPHLGEQLWEQLGHDESVFLSKWPEFDASVLVSEELTIVVQVNGKIRARLQVPADISEEELKKLALAHDRVKSYTERGVKKVVVVPGKLVSVVA
ncbi:leucine--tRNA ligase [Candidatus Zixiibacteriota bacterium]